MKRIEWISRLTVYALFLAVSLPVSAFPTRTESWKEDALLHDGRIIKVNREVGYTFQFVSGDEASMQLFASWPDKFWLEFEHPDTHETIKWQGEQYFNPVLLDIVDGIPYLVVYGRPDKSTEKIYGCPELPYIYLKYEKGFFGKWIPIQVEQAPPVLQDANLSVSSEVSVDEHKYASRDQILSNIRKVESSSGGDFQARIPRNYDDWHNIYRINYHNERKTRDCRPPPILPDVPLPKPVDMTLETVETKELIEESAVEYLKSLWEKTGPISGANCTKLFKSAVLENLMLGERFVNDSTGKKRPPYSGSTPFPSGRMLETRTKRYCDDKYVWFVAEHEELGKTIITKYTNAGDLLYNIRVVDPEIVDNKLAGRHMVPYSITAENGYFYSYWAHDIKIPFIKFPFFQPMERITKFRFREPLRPGTP